MFFGLCIQTCGIIYDPVGSFLGEVYNTYCVRVYCSGNLYRLNQDIKFLCKKKQILNDLLYRAQLKRVSQWQSMWLCVETAINMKFCNMRDVLCDKCNKSYITYKSNMKHKQNIIQADMFYTCIKK
jgi:hypothetical protein